MIQTSGYILVALGLIFITFGIIGIYRFKNFYSRILVASKVDTVGFITILTGVILINGFSYFSLKVFFVMVIALMINPLITHSIARSAVNSGYKIKKE